MICKASGYFLNFVDLLNLKEVPYQNRAFFSTRIVSNDLKSTRARFQQN
jgi:hypothetical protein